MSPKRKRLVTGIVILVVGESVLYVFLHAYAGYSLVWPFQPRCAIVAGPAVANITADEVRTRCRAAYTSVQTYRGTSRGWSDFWHIPYMGSSVVSFSRPSDLKVVSQFGFDFSSTESTTLATVRACGSTE